MGLNLIYLEGDGFGLCKLNPLQLISFNFYYFYFSNRSTAAFLRIYCTLMYRFWFQPSSPKTNCLTSPFSKRPSFFRMLIFFIYEFESIVQQLLIGIRNNEFTPILL
jgi:hypothetical protein